MQRNARRARSQSIKFKGYIMKKTVKRAKPIVALLLLCAVLLTSLLSVVAMAQSAEDNGNGQGSGVTGSYDLGWFEVWYDIDDVRITLRPDLGAVKDTRPSDIIDLAYEAIDAVKAVVIGQLEQQWKGEDGESLDIDGIWTSALEDFAYKQFPNASDPYMELCYGLLVGEEDDRAALTAEFSDYVCDMVRDFAGLGFTFPEADKHTLVEHLTTAVDKVITEHVVIHVEKGVSNYIEQVKAGKTPVADEDDRIERYAHQYIADYIDEELEAYIKEKVCGIPSEHHLFNDALDVYFGDGALIDSYILSCIDVYNSDADLASANPIITEIQRVAQGQSIPEEGKGLVVIAVKEYFDGLSDEDKLEIAESVIADKDYIYATVGDAVPHAQWEKIVESEGSVEQIIDEQFGDRVSFVANALVDGYLATLEEVKTEEPATPEFTVDSVKQLLSLLDTINVYGYEIFSDGSINKENIKEALKCLPDISDIRTMAEQGEALGDALADHKECRDPKCQVCHKMPISIGTDFGTFSLNLSIVIDGGDEYIDKLLHLIDELIYWKNRLVDYIDNHVDVNVNDTDGDSIVSVVLKMPGLIGRILTKIATADLDLGEYDDSIKQKIFKLLSAEFNDSDNDPANDITAVIGSVTLDELQAIFNAIAHNVEIREELIAEYMPDIPDNAAAKLESAYVKLENYVNNFNEDTFNKAKNKLLGYEKDGKHVDGYLERVLPFIKDVTDKNSLLDLYVSDGGFATGIVYKDHVLSLLDSLFDKLNSDKADKVYALIYYLSSYIEYDGAELIINNTGVYKITYHVGDATYVGLLPAGADISEYVGASSASGRAIIGWVGEDGKLIANGKMPAADTVATAVLEIPEVEHELIVGEGITSLGDGKYSIAYDGKIHSFIISVPTLPSGLKDANVLLEWIKVGDGGDEVIYSCEGAQVPLFLEFPLLAKAHSGTYRYRITVTDAYCGEPLVYTDTVTVEVKVDVEIPDGFFIGVNIDTSNAPAFGTQYDPDKSYKLVATPALSVAVPAFATYRWYKDGVAIPGATSATLDIRGDVADSGTYYCEVSILHPYTGVILTHMSDGVVVSIAKKQISISDFWTAAQGLAYNGSEQTAGSLKEGFESVISVSGDKATNAGNYTVTFEVIDSNYELVGDNTAIWTIAKKQLSVSEFWNAAQGLVYNGSEQTAGSLKEGFESVISVSGDKATNAGNYTVTFEVIDPNYELIDGANTAAWTIAEKQISINDFWNGIGTSFTYSGVEYTVGSVKAVYSEIISYTGTLSASNAGSYTVAFAVTDPNYVLVGADSIEWTIAKKTISLDDFWYVNLPHIFEFDGNIHGVADYIRPEYDGIVVFADGSVISAVDSGSYPISFEISEEFSSNYKLGATDGYAMYWRIGRALEFLLNGSEINAVDRIDYVFGSTSDIVLSILQYVGVGNTHDCTDSALIKWYKYNESTHDYDIIDTSKNLSLTDVADSGIYRLNFEVTIDGFIYSEVHSFEVNITPKTITPDDIDLEIPSHVFDGTVYNALEYITGKYDFISFEILPSGVTSAVKPGSYSIELMLECNENYVFEDGSRLANKTVSYTISKPDFDQSLVVWNGGNGLSVHHNGAAQSFVLTGFESFPGAEYIRVEYEGTYSATDIGEYEITGVRIYVLGEDGVEYKLDECYNIVGEAGYADAVKWSIIEAEFIGSDGPDYTYDKNGIYVNVTDNDDVLDGHNIFVTLADIGQYITVNGKRMRVINAYDIIFKNAAGKAVFSGNNSFTVRFKIPSGYNAGSLKIVYYDPSSAGQHSLRSFTVAPDSTGYAGYLEFEVNHFSIYAIAIEDEPTAPLPPVGPVDPTDPTDPGDDEDINPVFYLGVGVILILLIAVLSLVMVRRRVAETNPYRIEMEETVEIYDDLGSIKWDELPNITVPGDEPEAIPLERKPVAQNVLVIDEKIITPLEYNKAIISEDGSNKPESKREKKKRLKKNAISIASLVTETPDEPANKRVAPIGNIKVVPTSAIKAADPRNADKPTPKIPELVGVPTVKDIGILKETSKRKAADGKKTAVTEAPIESRADKAAAQVDRLLDELLNRNPELKPVTSASDKSRRNAKTADKQLRGRVAPIITGDGRLVPTVQYRDNSVDSEAADRDVAPVFDEKLFDKMRSDERTAERIERERELSAISADDSAKKRSISSERSERGRIAPITSVKSTDIPEANKLLDTGSPVSYAGTVIHNEMEPVFDEALFDKSRNSASGAVVPAVLATDAEENEAPKLDRAKRIAPIITSSALAGVIPEADVIRDIADEAIAKAVAENAVGITQAPEALQSDEFRENVLATLSDSVTVVEYSDMEQLIADLHSGELKNSEDTAIAVAVDDDKAIRAASVIERRDELTPVVAPVATAMKAEDTAAPVAAAGRTAVSKMDRSERIAPVGGRSDVDVVHNPYRYADNTVDKDSDASKASKFNTGDVISVDAVTKMDRSERIAPVLIGAALTGTVLAADAISDTTATDAPTKADKMRTAAIAAVENNTASDDTAVTASDDTMAPVAPAMKAEDTAAPVDAAGRTAVSKMDRTERIAPIGNSSDVSAVHNPYRYADNTVDNSAVESDTSSAPRVKDNEVISVDRVSKLDRAERIAPILTASALAGAAPAADAINDSTATNAPTKADKMRAAAIAAVNGNAVSDDTAAAVSDDAMAPVAPVAKTTAKQTAATAPTGRTAVSKMDRAERIAPILTGAALAGAVPAADVMNDATATAPAATAKTAPVATATGAGYVADASVMADNTAKTADATRRTAPVPNATGASYVADASVMADNTAKTADATRRTAPVANATGASYVADTSVMADNTVKTADATRRTAPIATATGAGYVADASAMTDNTVTAAPKQDRAGRIAPVLTGAALAGAVPAADVMNDATATASAASAKTAPVANATGAGYVADASAMTDNTVTAAPKQDRAGRIAPVLTGAALVDTVPAADVMNDATAETVATVAPTADTTDAGYTAQASVDADDAVMPVNMANVNPDGTVKAPAPAVNKDGRPIPVKAAVTPIVDANGKPVENESGALVIPAADTMLTEEFRNATVASQSAFKPKSSGGMKNDAKWYMMMQGLTGVGATSMDGMTDLTDMNASNTKLDRSAKITPVTASEGIAIPEAGELADSANIAKSKAQAANKVKGVGGAAFSLGSRDDIEAPYVADVREAPLTEATATKQTTDKSDKIDIAALMASMPTAVDDRPAHTDTANISAAAATHTSNGISVTDKNNTLKNCNMTTSRADIGDTIEVDGKKMEVVDAYDVTFADQSGNAPEYKGDDSFDVELPVPEGSNADELSVAHYDESGEGKHSLMESETVKDENGNAKSIKFKTSHFSIFAIVKDAPEQEAPVQEPKTETIPLPDVVAIDVPVHIIYNDDFVIKAPVREALITEQKPITEPEVEEIPEETVEEEPEVEEIPEETVEEEPEVEEAPVETVEEEPAVEETPEETVDEEPEVEEIPEETVDEEPEVEEAPEEIVEEAPAVEEAPEGTVEEEPAVEEVLEETVEEAPAVEEIPEETVEEAPAVEEIPEEIVEEAPVVEETAEEITPEEPAAQEELHLDAIHADELLTDEEAEEKIEMVEAPAASKSGKLVEINLDTLCENFEDGDTVTLEALRSKRLVKSGAGRIKVLARGTMTKRLTVIANKFSLQAVKMIVLAGGHADQLK